MPTPLTSTVTYTRHASTASRQSPRFKCYIFILACGSTCVCALVPSVPLLAARACCPPAKSHPLHSPFLYFPLSTLTRCAEPPTAAAVTTMQATLNPQAHADAPMRRQRERGERREERGERRQERAESARAPARPLAAFTYNLLVRSIACLWRLHYTPATLHLLPNLTTSSRVNGVACCTAGPPHALARM